MPHEYSFKYFLVNFDARSLSSRDGLAYTIGYNDEKTGPQV